QFADSGYYYLEAVSNNLNVAEGCTYVSDSVRVSVKRSPQKSVVSGDIEFCSNESVMLISSISENINWSTGSRNDTIQVTKGGTYTVTVTDLETKCKSTTPFSVIENKLPNLDFISPG